MPGLPAVSINSRQVRLQTIDRALYPTAAKKIGLAMPNDGTAVIEIDLESLWTEHQFAVNGIQVDLTRVGFFQGFSDTFQPLNTFGGMGEGGPIGSAQQEEQCQVVTPNGARFLCPVRAITTIALNGERNGILSIIWTRQDLADDMYGPNEYVAVYPMGDDPVAPVSFPVTLLNVPVESGIEYATKDYAKSPFDAQMDAEGIYANAIGQNGLSGTDNEYGFYTRTKMALAIPHKIVTFQSNDLGGPFAAPDSPPNVSRASYSALLAPNSAIPNLTIGNSYTGPFKLYQHLYIKRIAVALGKLLIESGIPGYYELMVNMTLPSNSGVNVKVCSFPFVWNGQDDFFFEDKTERYYNILDILQYTVNGQSLTAAPYLFYTLAGQAPGNTYNAGCNLRQEIEYNLMEAVPLP